MSYAALGYHTVPLSNCAPRTAKRCSSSAHETLRRCARPGDRESVLRAWTAALALESCRGVFVSLHRGAELLGCVGCSTSASPLAETVPDFALAAALDDPRFRPGAAVEGPVDIEISVLTPLRRVRSAGGFQVGRHGAVLYAWRPLGTAAASGCHGARMECGAVPCGAGAQERWMEDAWK